MQKNEAKQPNQPKQPSQGELKPDRVSKLDTDTRGVPDRVTKLVSDIRAALAVVNKQPEEVDKRVRAGHEIRRQAERQNLEMYRRQLRDSLNKFSVGIFVEGAADDVRRLVDFVQASGGAAADASAAYDRTCAALERAYGGSRSWSPGMWTLMMSELNDAGSQVGYSHQSVDWAELADTSPTGTMDHVRRSADRMFSGGLERETIVRAVMTAVEGAYAGGALPVVVYNWADDQRANLSPLFRAAVTVEVPPGFQPSSSSTMELFRGALSPQSQTNEVTQ